MVLGGVLKEVSGVVLTRVGLEKRQRWGMKECAVPPNPPDRHQWTPPHHFGIHTPIRGN